MPQHTEKDLDLLLTEKLQDCDYKNICLFKQTEEGRKRIIQRAKEIIFNDGITNIDTVFDKIDSQLLEERLEADMM